MLPSQATDVNNTKPLVAVAEAVASTMACPNGCNLEKTAKHARAVRVQFSEQVQVHETFHLDDLSDQERALYWISDEEWERMRQNFWEAKRRKCPTVEMSQPYRISDRKATIRYTRLVVLREHNHTNGTRQQQQQWNSDGKRIESNDEADNKATTNRNNHSTIPCQNCLADRISCLYRSAAKKSRMEAQETARLCEKEAQGYHTESIKEDDDGDAATTGTPCIGNPCKPKFLTAVTACY